MHYFNLLGETFPTTVNGPVNGYMIHLQGCSLGCQGCINPESWSFKNKHIVDVEELADRIIEKKPSILYISGGEPFLQSESLLHFLNYLHFPDKNCPFPKGILIFSGFYEHELIKNKNYQEILKYVDCIVSGRYEQDKRIYDSLLASSNQKFIWGKREKLLLNEKDISEQKFEVVIDENGHLTLIGFLPDWNKKIKENLKKIGVILKNN